MVSFARESCNEESKVVTIKNVIGSEKTAYFTQELNCQYKHLKNVISIEFRNLKSIHDSGLGFLLSQKRHSAPSGLFSHHKLRSPTTLEMETLAVQAMDNEGVS